MPLLTQTVLTLQTITIPTWTDTITLPAGCATSSLMLNLLFSDLHSSKNLEVNAWSSADGGTTWIEQGGFRWTGPATGVLEMGSSVLGYDGLQIKALLTPDSAGITTDAIAEVH